MPQHVRVSLETKLCSLSSPFHHPRKAGGAEGRAALRGEHEGRSRILLTLQPAERSQLVTADGMGTRRALLDAANCQRGRLEVDLVPSKVNQLAGAEAVAIGDQDHGGVAVAPAVGFGGFLQ
jgi:hypothetical protein